MDDYDVPRPAQPFISDKDHSISISTSPTYANVGRTVEMELDYMEVNTGTRTEMEEGSEDRSEEGTVETQREKPENKVKFHPWRMMLVITVVLSFLLSLTAAAMAAAAISRQ